MGYLIVARADNETVDKYYHIGEWTGEWVRDYKRATEFRSMVEAQDRLEGSEFTRKQTMSDGTIYPPHMIQDGANINSAHRTGSVTLSIVKLIPTFSYTEDNIRIIQASIDTETKEMRLNQIASLMEESGLTAADIEFFNQHRK